MTPTLSEPSTKTIARRIAMLLLSFANIVALPSPTATTREQCGPIGLSRVCVVST
jgi:hypothetical protein